MQKQEALAVISNHLSLLTNYDVIEATFADTLFDYLEEIIMAIDENPVDSRVDAVADMIDAWAKMKKHEGDNDFGKP
jgi:hypothetical protein